ncbi:hypothetical protein [Kitasatospora sp. NPDC093558]|uniref:hypothetical protein n=1 Tax=Kitasatospora sp. NPDC093558 TaxID=3155201 RepID=UPI00343F8D98
MKTMRFLTAPAVGLALAAALTAATTTGAAATAPAVPDARATSAVLYLTNADHGRTVAVSVGDVIEVHLSAVRTNGATWVWIDVPAASDPNVLNRVSGGVSVNGDTDAVFSATTAGTSDITAYSRCVPDPGYACPAVLVPWKATVNVS